MGKKVIVCLLIFSISLSLASCQTDQGYLQPDILNQGLDNESNINNDVVIDRGPVKGGTLNLFSTFPDTMNPMLTKNIYVRDFLSFIYEGLVRLDEKQRPEPVLSDKWYASEDGLVWNFHIREGVIWSDGIPFTADDIEFTMNKLFNDNSDSIYKKLLQNITTFAAVDSSNFRIILRKPNSFTAETMTFPIIPSHLPEVALKKADFKPIGTGPYIFFEYQERKSVVLKRNEEWWQAGADKSKSIPLFDNIKIKLYSSPEDSADAFQTNSIDAACLGMEDIEKYDTRTDLIIKKYCSRDFEFLAFNLRNPVFADVSVRKAVAASIDREDLIKNILGGYAVMSDMPVNPDSWLLEGLKVITANSSGVLKPNEILLAGGWKENEKGYYKIFNGVKKQLEIVLMVNKNNRRRILTADKICGQLIASDISSKVEVLPWDTMYGLIDSGKFDMAYTGCRITQVPDVSFLYSNSYLPSFMPLPDNIARNISGYGSNEANSRIELMYEEIDNIKRKNIFSDLKVILNKDMPYIGLFFLDNAMIYKKNVRGSLEPYVWNRYNDIAGWYLPDLQQ